MPPHAPCSYATVYNTFSHLSVSVTNAEIKPPYDGEDNNSDNDYERTQFSWTTTPAWPQVIIPKGGMKLRLTQHAFDYRKGQFSYQGATIRYSGGGARKIRGQEIIYFTSKWRENIFFTFSITTYIHLYIFFTNSYEEFMYFEIFLSSPMDM